MFQRWRLLLVLVGVMTLGAVATTALAAKQPMTKPTTKTMTKPTTETAEKTAEKAATKATPKAAPNATAGAVIANLFEWNWTSVARECRDSLGPHGYGYVQVSPPQEHVRGPQWWVAY